MENESRMPSVPRQLSSISFKNAVIDYWKYRIENFEKVIASLCEIFMTPAWRMLQPGSRKGNCTFRVSTMIWQSCRDKWNQFLLHELQALHNKIFISVALHQFALLDFAVNLFTFHHFRKIHLRLVAQKTSSLKQMPSQFFLVYKLP